VEHGETYRGTVIPDDIIPVEKAIRGYQQMVDKRFKRFRGGI
jgi:hypothetical protein